MAKTNSNQPLYEEVGDEYFENRQLHRGLSWILLWGWAVGAVIAGHFVGWNVGLVTGGFWGMVIATTVVAIMYSCLVFSVAELSAALPYAGGFYSFARQAFGPYGGFICGVTLLIEYLLAPAVIVVVIGNYLNMLLPTVSPYLWWVLLYVAVVLINILWLRFNLMVGLLVTILSILGLFIFYVSAVATEAFHISLLFNLTPEPTQSAYELPKGWTGVLAALPFAIWFYRGIEQLPFAAEETHEVTVNMSKMLRFGMLALVILSFLMLFFLSGVNGGVSGIGTSETPLLEGLMAVFHEDIRTALIIIMLTALMAGLQSTLVASGRIVFALSRAGYLPRELSVTNRYHRPIRALVLSAVVGLISVMAIDVSGIGNVLTVLLSIVAFSALVSYALIFISYVDLEREEPDLLRPYLSPLGVPGAMVGGILCSIVMVAYFSIPEFRLGIYFVLLSLLLATFYFQFMKRSQLVAQAPEENRALESAKKPHNIQKFVTSRVIVSSLLLLTVYSSIRFGLVAFSNVCPPDCVGQNLMRQDFSGQNLRGINFVGADLRGANFEEAILTEADLSGATLIEANLVDADLRSAKFVGANLLRADFTGAIFSDTNMKGADLSQANFTNADLREVRLTGVILKESTLIGADLRGVEMPGVEFIGAELKRANLSGANLAGTSFSTADLSGADLTGADLTGAWLNLSNLTGTNLTSADLSGSIIIGANFSGTNLFKANMVGSTLIGSLFKGANLKHADLSNSRSKKSDFIEEEDLIDPILDDMNNIERENTIKDADFSGIQKDSQTIWPSEEASED